MTSSTLFHSHARLEISYPDGQTSITYLDRNSLTVGRDTSCNVAVPGSLKTISRKHAEFLPGPDGYQVRDLGSQNGVYVNGLRVSNAVRLNDGDVIHLGFQGGKSEVVIKVFLNVPDQPGAVGARDLHPYLVFRWPDGRLTSIELTGISYTAGRSEDADLPFPSNLGYVSNQHFVLRRQDGGFWLEDLASKNGTRLNNQLLTPGKAVRLSDGDTIRVGDDQRSISIGIIYHDPSQSNHITGSGWKPVEKATVIVRRTEEFTIGRSSENQIVLASNTVSRKHARITSIDDRYAIEDLNSRNGTFVNGERTQSAELFDGDLIEIGGKLLLFQQGKITPYTSQGFRLDVVGLSKSFMQGKQRREILRGIDMTILPKEFLAIVGASGSGKTTLMRALNGTSPGEGRVLLNGHDFYEEYDLFRHQIGYVPQFEILHNVLTVEQALDFAARLRLPPELSRQERAKRIEQALVTVSMDAPKIRSTKIANLSGGQRRRVSIAAELIADPNLIYLDEATSGLDPGLEKKMMYTLRKMADEGRTIVLITHATANIVQADHVAFLSQGKLVFFGPSRDALPFFEVDEFADIYDRIEKQGDHWESVFQNEQSEKYQRYILERQQSRKAIPVKRIKPRRGSLSGFIRQLALLTERTLKVIMSDRITLLLLLLLFPLTALLQLVIATPFVLTGDPAYLADPVGAAADLARAYTPFADMNTFVFVMGLEAVLVGLFVPSTELLKERLIYRRERMINLGLVPYLASKIIVFTLFSFVQVLLYMLVLSLGVDYLEAGIFLPGPLEIFMTLFLTMLAGNGLGLAVSAISRSNEVAIYILTLMLFFQFFFAGAVFDLRDQAAEPLSYLTTTRWSLVALGSTLDMEGITGSTVLCNTLDNPLTPEIDEVTRCFHYPEAVENLMLPYGKDKLLQSWGVLLLTMAFGLVVTGVLIRRLDTL